MSDPIIAGKAGAVALVAVASAWLELLMVDAVRSTLITLVAITALCVYRILRKFRKEAIATKLDFLDRNLVEIILFFVIAPNAANTFTELGRRLFSAIP